MQNEYIVRAVKALDSVHKSELRRDVAVQYFEKSQVIIQTRNVIRFARP